MKKALKDRGGEEILSKLVTSDDPQSPSKVLECIIRLTHQGWNLPRGVSEEDMTEGNSEEEENSSEDIDSLLNKIEPVEVEEKGDKEEKLQEEDMFNLLEGIDSVDEQPQNPSPINRRPELSQVSQEEEAEEENIVEERFGTDENSIPKDYERIIASLKQTVVKLCEERDNLRKERQKLYIGIPEELDSSLREIAIELGKNNTPFSPAELKKVYNGAYDKTIGRGAIGRVFQNWLSVGFVKRLTVNNKAVRGYYLLVVS